jgi:hypothetical protein
VSESEFLANENMDMDQQNNIGQLAGYFLQHAYNDIFRRKFHFVLAFCSVYLVVVCTLVVNQIISKGSIIFLKMGESTHGEIDAFITPAADLIRSTIDGVEYDVPAQLNYTAFNDYFVNNDPESLERLLVAPRKVFTGVKMVTETESGLYDSSSPQQMETWHKNLDKATGLPHRGDVYHVNFPAQTDDSSLVAFKTLHERNI